MEKTHICRCYSKLPFGLRLAPKILNALADALERCVAKKGVDHIYHYLDDFIVVGPPDNETCSYYLETLKRCVVNLVSH